MWAAAAVLSSRAFGFCGVVEHGPCVAVVLKWQYCYSDVCNVETCNTNCQIIIKGHRNISAMAIIQILCG